MFLYTTFEIIFFNFISNSDLRFRIQLTSDDASITPLFGGTVLVPGHSGYFIPNLGHLAGERHGRSFVLVPDGSAELLDI